jgi:hypothetical protein
MKNLMLKILLWVAICTMMYCAFGCASQKYVVEKPVKMKPVKSQRPKTDIMIMGGVLFIVVMWCNEEGFTKHIN